MQKSSFAVVLKNNKSEIQLKYKLNQTSLAQSWYKKIKHLYLVPVSNTESNLIDVSDLETIYKEFCKFAGLDYEPIVGLNQTKLNKLHEIYEKSHLRLSKLKNNEILYKFHHAIHANEQKENNKNHINVGWGVKEGPLTNNLRCNKFYEKNLLKSHIYLPWAELGKTPLQYWRNGEPNNKARVLELVKPHITFRAKFFIQLKDETPESLPLEFENWFQKYKDSWLKIHQISKWDRVDEYCAPLLGIPDHNHDVLELHNNGYKFERIIYDCN